LTPITGAGATPLWQAMTEAAVHHRDPNHHYERAQAPQSSQHRQRISVGLRENLFVKARAVVLQLSTGNCKAHPIRAPIAAANAPWLRISQRLKRIRMSELQEQRTLEREEIAARVAIFKATQEKFQRDREKYYAATMAAARAVKRNEPSGAASGR
jgi:hypothetical protein